MIALDRFKLSIQRVALTDEDIPPPLGALESRLTKHVEEPAPGVGGQLLEVGAHGVEHGLAGDDHVVTDGALLVERIALGRVAAEVCAEVGHVLGLLKLGPFLVVHHGGLPSSVSRRLPW